MPASSPPRRQQRPSDRGRVTHEQVVWITHRDRLGKVIDAYLRTDPPAEMRTAVEGIEDSLRVGDYASGLTA